MKQKNFLTKRRTKLFHPATLIHLVMANLRYGERVKDKIEYNFMHTFLLILFVVVVIFVFSSS